VKVVVIGGCEGGEGNGCNQDNVTHVFHVCRGVWRLEAAALESGGGSSSTGGLCSWSGLH
jgi:hypothetical protein